MRAFVPAACALAACSAPQPIRLALPVEAEAADARTLLLSLEHQGARTTVVIDRENAAATALPIIAEWSEDEPASYTLLTYAETVAELDVTAGPAITPVDPQLAVGLPAPRRAFRADITADAPPAWSNALPIPPALAGLQLTRATRPIDCSTSLVRVVELGDDTLDLLGVVATSPDTALVTTRRAGVLGLAELLESGVVEPRPLPPEISRITTMATDGQNVWATDSGDHLVLLGLDGTFIAHSPSNTIDGVVASPDGRTVFAWAGNEVFTLVASSTRTTLVPTGAARPPRIDHLGPSPTGDLIAVSGSEVWVFSGRAWRNELQPERDFGRVTSVAADELGYYAVTGAALFRRDVGDPLWDQEPDISTFERYDVVSWGQGRRAVSGSGGFLELWPDRPPFGKWCVITTGTFRELSYISVDPTRRTLFSIDGIDGDGSEPSSLVMRITLPR